MATAGFFVGLAAIGALRLAQTLCGVLNAVLQVLENYSLPRASVILSAENMQQFRDYLFTTGKQTILLAVPFLFTLIAFPRQVMLFAGGAEFIAYTYVLQGMALVYTIILVGYPIRLAIRALLMNREFFIAYAASGIFSLLAVKTIIAQWHLAGVLVALTVNQLLVLFYWTWVLKRKNIVIWKSFM